MPKTIILLACSFLLVRANAQQAGIRLQPNASAHQISRHIYGHFAEHLGRCIYDGFWVADSLQVPKQGRIRMDVVNALKKIRVPNLRWPGGCFADEYHWRDGIGPRTARPTMINTHWGGVTEDNSFGTHEFLELCQLLEAEPYIAGNVGSGTVAEMSGWVEYLNFDGISPMTRLRKENGRDKPWKVSFWGVGNESWGCGGNMTAEYYTDLYRQYATYARNYPGAPLRKVASGANAGDYHWTEVCMKNIPLHQLWGLTLHYYTLPTNDWSKKGSATQFTEPEYFQTMKHALHMEELVTKHSAIMDKYDKDKRVALAVDEWGIWTDVEPGTNPGFLFQQNSLRDALIAATTLNIFNNHSDRVRMANLAQTINVLQSVILTRGRDLLLTPTYHVFDLYKVHQDAQYLPLELTGRDYSSGAEKIPAINASASKDSLGRIHISLVNIDPNTPTSIRINAGGLPWKKATGQVLTAARVTDINSFEQKEQVRIQPFSAFKKEGDQLVVDLPAKSVVVLELQ
ncbi:MAG: alpha-L-arabinofuranosidase C-terminal domain-containing protein [Candidatus Pseudobacter hemicellulosilyticus]|uniref:non-reducing end alpha-L-arabinofuranosidase n=1 Tax=Candidatus Pseudobacter hemicellulosilyticus TaxID=3121375 RepID=A0AAJ6BFP5_9BACT|nr:MAG: alpha-L-arabinofuranosidase C-terminal domain-containing protein [Pseudobacter sp.]